MLLINPIQSYTVYTDESVFQFKGKDYIYVWGDYPSKSEHCAGVTKVIAYKRDIAVLQLSSGIVIGYDAFRAVMEADRAEFTA